LTKHFQIDCPLVFKPVLKQALWGGTRLEQLLGKAGEDRPQIAESWEVCDVPGDVSLVEHPSVRAGISLRDLMNSSSRELLGQHSFHRQFPLLIKFLDATRCLSLQVHPRGPIKLANGLEISGKAESWVVMDAPPGNQTFLGLRDGVTPEQLRTALHSGNVLECLHCWEARIGDCIHIEPGTLHALGAGLLVAEIQQPEDFAFRLFDWNRADAQGIPRPLQMEAGIAATDFTRGPLFPIVPRPRSGRTGSELLVDSQHFLIERHFGEEPLLIPHDDRMHVFMVLSGTARQSQVELQTGQTAVIPAACSDREWVLSKDAIVLDSYLPMNESC